MNKLQDGWKELPPSRNKEWNERFRDRPPHVFVGICAFGDIPHEIYLSHTLWALQAGQRYSGRFAVSLGMATRSEQYRARNKLIRQAQVEGADFLMMIDDDQTLHECPEIIDKFWELGQPIAGGLYYNRGGAYLPVILREHRGPNGVRHARFIRHEEIPDEPAPVDVLGGGCHWVDMRVFDKLREPHFWPFPVSEGGGPMEVYYPHPRLGLDVHFCFKARDAGYECWLHPGIKLGHLKHDREVISYDTLPPLEELQQRPEYVDYMVNVMGVQPNERANGGVA